MFFPFSDIIYSISYSYVFSISIEYWSIMEALKDPNDVFSKPSMEDDVLYGAHVWLVSSNPESKQIS